MPNDYSEMPFDFEGDAKVAPQSHTGPGRGVSSDENRPEPGLDVPPDESRPDPDWNMPPDDDMPPSASLPDDEPPPPDDAFFAANEGEYIDDEGYYTYDMAPEDREGVPVFSADDASSSLLSTLNDEQREAALHMDGPCLVTAGPGTGKTHTMTARVENLVRNGVSPDNILVMTFTKKAAGEIRDRLASVHPAFKRVRAGTFHSIAIEIIRNEMRKLNKTYTLIDDTEEKNALAGVFYTAAGLKKTEDADGVDFWAVHTVFSKWAQDGVMPEPGELRKVSEIYMDGAEDPSMADSISESFYNTLDRVFARGTNDFASENAEGKLLEIFEHFKTYKQEQSIFSFDDCIIEASRILSGPSGARYRSRYQYVNVDEFQDSDVRQIEFVSKLVADHNNIFVVGDDKQAIYAWRGAHFRVFDDFREVYSPREVALVRNYRSTDEIISSVNTVAKIRPRASSPLVGCGNNGHAATMYEYTNYDPSVAAHDIVSALLSSGNEYKDMAVLFSSHAFGTSAEVQAELDQRKIPYEVVGGRRITDSVLFKDCKNVMRIMDNPGYEMGWRDLAAKFPGIGAVAALKISNALKDAGSLKGAVEVLDEMKVTPSLSEGKRLFRDFVAKLASLGKTPSPQEVCDAVLAPLALCWSKMQFSEISRLSPECLDWNIWLEKPIHAGRVIVSEVGDMVKEMRKTKGAAQVKKVENAGLNAMTGVTRSLNIMRFIASFNNISSTCGAWLDNVSFDDNQKKDDEEKKNRITLSTIHGAKGREWNMVVVPELIGGCFPAKRLMAKLIKEASLTGRSLREVMNNDVDYNEKKNLLYVAVSRAKKELIMMCGRNAPSTLLLDLAEKSVKDGSIRTKDGKPWGGNYLAFGKHEQEQMARKYPAMR